MGFSDREIARLWHKKEPEVYSMRKTEGILPVYKMIDTCASEFESYIPYFYSTYAEENESVISDKKKIVVLGSGQSASGRALSLTIPPFTLCKPLKNPGMRPLSSTTIPKRFLPTIPVLISCIL